MKGKASDRSASFERLKALAWLLDSSIRLPGGFRVGLDALIGLVPFFGDMAGVVLSAYIVGEAARLGAPPSLLLRMALNVLVEGLIGVMPVLGDLFDAVWKANQRNIRLLERYLENPRGTVRANRLFLAFLLFLPLLFTGLALFVTVAVLRWAWNAGGA